MTSARTRFVVLGRLAIDRDGVPSAGAALAGRRSELVFAYLAAEHRRSVSRDELADALWPDTLPETWNAALRSVLSDVRRFLEGAGLDPSETLLTEQGRLRLRLPDDAVLDLDQAREALASAHDLLAAGDAAAAAQAAERAVGPAALPFLSHHEGSWADSVRSELDELHIRALEILARALAQAGDTRAAVAAADRLVRADPFSESAHRLRIEVLGAAGDRAGARKAYERCKALLASELGIDPSAETEAALEQALGDRRGAPPGADADVALGRFGAYSVLVVEDHDFQRRTALTLLRGLGVGALTEAADGASALALLEASAAPDIIVCDIDMPGMDGVEFIRHVAERRLASAVAIASGLDRRLLETVRAASEGYGLQVLGAIGKPLTAKALEALLAAYRPPPPGAGADAGGTAAAIAALADGTLPVDFEPIVDLARGTVTGVRAVAGGPAGDLLTAVDAAGLGRRFAEHVLGRAGDAVRDRDDLSVWVPLAPSLLTDVSLADALTAIASDRVVLVVGAAGLARGDRPAVLDVLARLRVKGYGLCVDGFGLGGESLARLPLTHVQLPAPLVATAAASGDATQLQEAVDAARALDVPVIGGCATEAEFDLLLALGCSFAHGPFVAAPVPADELDGSVREMAWAGGMDGAR